MNLLDIYSLLRDGKVTVEDAAKALGMTPRDLKIRMTKYGHRFPLVLSILDKIRADEISRVDAAHALGVSVRQINHLMEHFHIKRPLKEYLVSRTASQIKWELRKKFAIDFIADTCTIEEAAESAQVSTRQMRRWVSELLNKHFGMVYKDLKGLAPHRRRRLANDIESAENLELSKQGVLQEIADGRKSLKEEALERVTAKKGRFICV